MNITLLVQFLALLEEMKTREEILPEFERLLDRCGFDFYGIVRQPKPHENPLRLLLPDAGRRAGRKSTSARNTSLSIRPFASSGMPSAASAGATRSWHSARTRTASAWKA